MPFLNVKFSKLLISLALAFAGFQATAVEFADCESHLSATESWFLAGVAKFTREIKVRSVRRILLSGEAREKAWDFEQWPSPVNYRILRPAADTFVAEASRKLAGLPWARLIRLVTVMSSEVPYELHLRTSFAQALLDNGAGFEERRETMRSVKAIQENKVLFDYFDEIMGIPREKLDAQEQREREQADREELQQIGILGVGTGHSFWFSRYSILVQVLNRMQREKVNHVADLGCGTGRLGLLIGFLYPQMQFTGAELHQGRVTAAQEAARRWGLEGRVRFVQQDLLDPKLPLPDAEGYYIYGPTNSYQINQKIIDRLMGTPHPFVVISTHHMTTAILTSAPRTRPARSRGNTPYTTFYAQ